MTGLITVGIMITVGTMLALEDQRGWGLLFCIGGAFRAMVLGQQISAAREPDIEDDES